MIAAGYMAKKVANDLFSVSGCISGHFCDYIQAWKHNGFWLFDSPELIAEVAAARSVDMAGMRLFYYELYEKQFDEARRAWQPFGPEAAFRTEVEPPASRRLEGFDVVTFSCQTSPECSPLSCNGLAQSIAVNEHCLLPSLEEAVRLVESGAFDRSEPGPFRILAVYSC